MLDINAPPKRTVLFLCSGNSARSQMAEALLRHKAGDFFDVYSAGTHPEKVDVRTYQALTNFGLSTTDLKSKNLTEFNAMIFDFVITLCDKATHECRDYVGASTQMAWNFPDPKSRGGGKPFTATLNEINNRMAMFLLVEEKKQRTNNDVLLHQQLPANNIDPISFYKCLTDDIRLKCLMLMTYHGELCVCELMTALAQESQPKVSRNLALLKKNGLLTTRKHGQWVFYQVNSALPPWLRTVLATTTEHNIKFIEQNLQQLAQMTNRPSKVSFS